MMVVMDSFALPVEGTETRVNAQAQGYEYMTAYIEAAKQVGRLENAIGWYHSHPGTVSLPPRYKYDLERIMTNASESISN